MQRQPPTWKEVGVPDIVVRTITAMKPTYTMDCLISQLVYHNYKRTYSVYFCDACGSQYIPAKTTEEVNQCDYCQSKRVRCLHSVKFSSEKKMPYYVRQSSHMLSIIKQMESNFINYFGEGPQRDIDWEWHDGIYHVAFAGGETGCGEVPRIAIGKAALLTPYLWDSMHDWKNGCKFDLGEQRHISHILSNIVLKKE